MWPFKKKSISIRFGEIKDLFFDIPEDKKIKEIKLSYENENGEKYETLEDRYLYIHYIKELED